jgi:glycosidase
MWTVRSNRCKIHGGKNVPDVGVGRDPEPTPMQWEPGPNAGFTIGTLHHGFRWTTIATQRDRDGEAVGGTLALRPDEGLVVELA